MRTSLVMDSLRQTQRDLFLAQTRIATGRSFITPSEDPVSAARAVDLTQALARHEQFVANVQYGDNFLLAADSAIAEIADLLTQSSVIASQTVGGLTSAAEREAEAEVVAAILLQLQAVGNRQFGGRYIFAGRTTADRPFIDALGGVAYVGDTGDLVTRINSGLMAAFNMPGNELYSALSSPIATDIDLTPVLTASTRFDDITGANGRDIRIGTLVFNEVGGAGVFTVDLSGADTIGDIVSAINQAATEVGASLTASLDDTGLVITPGGSAVSVNDQSAGVVAADLGILTNEPTTEPIVGGALIPHVTRLTPVESLAGGSGIDLDGGLTITNGGRTVTIDLSNAETVQDIINEINNAGVFVLARINEAGTGIDVFNQVSGASLAIGENGGTTAADLGIRTFDAATPLSQLNFGRGVAIVEGKDDVRITAKDGSTVDVDLEGAVTVGEVIELINEASEEAGVMVSASFAEVGNGIRITDETGGDGDLSVAALNLSAAAMDLGLVQTVSEDGTELSGDDVNPMRTEGIIDALVDLENALRSDDTQGISLAGARLDSLRGEVTRMHGVIGARSQAMTQRLTQIDDAATSTQIFLSQIEDLDYAEAVTRVQAAIMQLQANMQTSSSLLSMSLMDYLR